MAYIPIRPFRDWIRAELEKLEVDETIEAPAATLAGRLDTAERYLLRWRSGLNGSDRPTRLIRFLRRCEGEPMIQGTERSPDAFRPASIPGRCYSCGTIARGWRNGRGRFLCDACMVPPTTKHPTGAILSVPGSSAPAKETPR